MEIIPEPTFWVVARVGWDTAHAVLSTGRGSEQELQKWWWGEAEGWEEPGCVSAELSGSNSTPLLTTG